MISLSEMPGHARLWVYQSDRKFTNSEVAEIRIETESFLNSWAAHGAALKAAYNLYFDQVLVLAVDESFHGASGCSIDDSVKLVRSFEAKYGVSMMDRTNVALVKDDQLQLRPMFGLKGAVEKGEIESDTIVLNNAVSNYSEFQTSWKQSASESWLKRFFA